MLRDPEFDMVRLRAFGTYEIRIDDPRKFITEIVGTDRHFSTDEIDAQLTNLIVSKFASVMGENEIAALDLAANYEKLSSFITAKISPYFEEYGLSLTKILIENISLPEEVEKTMDRRTSREITDDLDANLKYQTGEALGNKNSGGAAEMVGMGAGLAMANQMVNDMHNKTETPPPIPNIREHYYIAIDKKAHGPYDTDTIKKLARDGTVIGDTLVWTEGMEKWQKASTVLSRLFKTTPPSL
jgi:membrane protease subunit (stomatin/prohibitin family)